MARQKRVRRKGVQKLWGLRMYQTTGSGPDQSEIKLYNQRLQSVRRGEAVPPTRMFHLRHVHGETVMPRALVLATLGKGLPDVDVKRMFQTILIDSKYESYSLFGYANEERYFVMRLDKQKQTISRSIIYTKREWAMAAYSHRTLEWKEADIPLSTFNSG